MQCWAQLGKAGQSLAKLDKAGQTLASLGNAGYNQNHINKKFQILGLYMDNLAT